MVDEQGMRQRVEVQLRRAVDEYARIAGQERRIVAAVEAAMVELSVEDRKVAWAILRQSIHDQYALEKQQLVRRKILLASLLMESKAGTSAWMYLEGR